MSELSSKIEIIQTWIASLKRNQPLDASKSNLLQITLSEMISLIQQEGSASAEQSMAATYDDLEQQVQEQTDALNRATIDLKSQINERETAARNLRQAYNNLETHLQEHIAYQSKLNQRLQKQINEQKRIQQVEQEERVLTEALRDTLATMGRTLDLDKILDHILDTVQRVTPYDGANVLLVESDLVRVARQKGYIEKGAEQSWLEQRIPLAKLAILQHLIDLDQPLAIPDTTTSPIWMGFPGLDWVHSNVIAPIRSDGKILGFLSLDSATPNHFTQTHAERLQGFADQAAIAIQNARLLDRAKRVAALAERNRLANEMHDTISQTLWSISLISERLPEIWGVNQAEGRRGLTTLHELAQNALNEMRSLLLELHPSSIIDAELGVLIRHIAEIITNRTELKTSVQIEHQEPIPPDVHFALYRVVQEALNNVVLHASARCVEIFYNSQAGLVDLTIQDDGQGFDITQIAPGHLGLSIMTDRIQNIGGSLETISSPNNGTLIKVQWQAPTDAD